MIGQRHLRDIRVKDAIILGDCSSSWAFTSQGERVLRNLYFSESIMLQLKIWIQIVRAFALGILSTSGKKCL